MANPNNVTLIKWPIGGRIGLLGADGKLAIDIACCCCVADLVLHPVATYIDEANWTGAAPEPPQSLKDQYAAQGGFFLGIQVADSRNLNSVFDLVYYLAQCGQETVDFAQPVLDWMNGDPAFEEPQTELVINFGQVESDVEFDYLFYTTSFDPDRFAAPQQEYPQSRKSYETCCNEINGSLVEVPYPPT